MARTSDPNVRIKAIELLNKMQREEAEANAKPEENLEETCAALIALVPQEGAGSFLALSAFLNSGGFIGSYPFLAETAPIVARHFPTEWFKWRAKEKEQWVTDFLDKAAAGPVLEEGALFAAVKGKVPKVRPNPTKENADV